VPLAATPTPLLRRAGLAPQSDWRRRGTNEVEEEAEEACLAECAEAASEGRKAANGSEEGAAASAAPTGKRVADRGRQMMISQRISLSRAVMAAAQWGDWGAFASLLALLLLLLP
jgi:hypothetical protein